MNKYMVLILHCDKYNVASFVIIVLFSIEIALGK